jgi:hypothetical protein
MTYLTLTVSFFCLLSVPLHAQYWVRGAAYLHAVEGQVLFSELGQTPVAVTQAQIPFASSALMNCAAAYGSSAFFSNSNRSQIYFEGEGSFSIERMEQVEPEAWSSGHLESAQSRMILDFRAGSLIVDNRNMLDSSQCLVETPLGRLSVKRALWQMNIVYDVRSQIYDFTINCSSGRLRFTDLQGQQYTLRAGQRLAGAGSRTMPSIEVGEGTERSIERMERFQELEVRYESAVNNLDLYVNELQEINQVDRLGPDLSMYTAAAVREPTHRPIVIEYADEPDEVTPFRGEMAAPSEWQTDLF